ncbi:MAG: hypothetical protein IKL55_04015 [Clostridia bacterium]|nr:hypothetical protein [Clostridia bacterium]
MEKTNDYKYVDIMKEVVQAYINTTGRLDDEFFERFFGKKAQAAFLSGMVENNSVEDAMIMNGLAGVDCRKIDFSKLSLKNYMKIPFDSNTQFPEDIKQVFNSILEKSKQFGFGLEGLLQEGKLSGEGINVAIIDEDVDVSNMDTDDINLIYHGESTGHHYHGQTVSSLLASKSCGVAKGAKVHFFQKTKEKDKQFEQIIEYNKNCTNESDKITVLSGSWSIKGAEFEKWQQALRTAGCELVCQNNFVQNFTEISGDDVILNMTEEEKEGFSEGMRQMIEAIDLSSLVKIPINRTYHQYKDEGFKYQASYSNSWGIPQVAGLLALYKAKDKSLTFEDFCGLCRETASEKGVINPVGIYEEVEKRLERAKQNENQCVKKIDIEDDGR